MNGDQGTTFRKMDLHIHTPQSMCYGEPSVTLEQIVDAAKSAGLEVMAITDHNTVAAIDGIRRAAEEKGLFVFPGIELSTSGGHLFALFERDTPVEHLVDFLDGVGIAREGWGDAATVAEGDVEGILCQIGERGGIAIAAHIERWPSGFLQTSESRQVKMGIHGSSYLSALEITIPQNKSLWNAGQMRGYPKKYACIQGSDAHALDEIGRRPVYIRMERVDLPTLRSVFLECEDGIVFPHEFPPE